MNAICIRGLSHNYRYNFWETAKVALDGLDLDVAEGETFGYLGMNGAGKTTTIKILVGLLRQSRGTATLFDAPASQVGSRRQMGFQPENPYFYEYLTARESMDFYAGLSDVPRKERSVRAGELLAFVGLEDAADVRVGDFSKGMRQRLGIAQCIVHKPRLVILDEPMTGLDPVGRSQVRNVIQTLKGQGMTVFFSSHVLSDVEMICDRVGLLHKGRLMASGLIDELLEPQACRTEIVVEGAASNLQKEFAASMIGSTSDRRQAYSVTSQASADRLVAMALEGKGRVVSLRSQRETLEQYFVRTTGATRRELGAWSGGGDQ